MSRELRRFLAGAGPLARDTRLAAHVLARYAPGVLLCERGFTDASCRLGGLVAPHRFLIISDRALLVEGSPAEGRGLCVLPPDSLFKVIDRASDGGREQVALLHVPPELLPVLGGGGLGAIEERYAAMARECFSECLALPPVPELDNDAWRARLLDPPGLDDDGEPFPLPAPVQAALRTAAAGAAPPAVQVAEGLPAGLGAGDTLTAEEGIRAGDIVHFVRTGPGQVAVRRGAGAEGEPLFRAVGGKAPGQFVFAPVQGPR